MPNRIICIVLGENGCDSIVEGDRFISALCRDETIAAICHLLIRGGTPYGDLQTETKRLERGSRGPHRTPNEWDIHPMQHGGQMPKPNPPGAAEAVLSSLSPAPPPASAE